ncbi:hypothetical protein CEN39_03015 [Fischerella thermalis CCMEE 5201]|jgi:hypothetical protein|nr:hypothetical protein CEN39_03015 [Fischerella thermalis CCMEE 5201]
MIFEFPSEDNWRRISCTFPFEKLSIPINSFNQYSGEINNLEHIEHICTDIELNELTEHLQSRLRDVYISYVMLCFYFDKGIPDGQWFISPGMNGESVQYFPHFTEYDFHVKNLFDFYADTFYYKLFSVVDTIGHILNIVHNLEIQEPNLKNVMKELKKKNPDIYKKLMEFKEEPAFKDASKYRNEITHNFLPGVVSGIITSFSDVNALEVEKNLTSIGVGKYVPSATIRQNVVDVLYVFVEILDYLKKDGKQSVVKP